MQAFNEFIGLRAISRVRLVMKSRKKLGWYWFCSTYIYFFFWYWTSLTTRREILREFLTFLPIRISFFLFLNFLPFSNFSRHLSLSLSSSSHSLTYSLTHKRAVCAHTFSTTNDFFWLLINNNNNDDILYDLNQSHVSLFTYRNIYVDFSKWASPPSSEWSTRTFYSDTFAVASWHDFQSYKSRSFT